MSLPYKFLHLTINHLAFFFIFVRTMKRKKTNKFYMIIKYKLPNVVCNVDFIYTHIPSGSIPDLI